jgi:hypothetical protein
MNRPLVLVVCALTLTGQLMPPAWSATQPDLNFKIYSPDAAAAPAPATAPATAPTTGGALAPKSDDSVNAPSASPATPDKAPSDSLWSTDVPAKGPEVNPTDTTPTVPPAAAETTVVTPATPTAAGDASPAQAAGDATSAAGAEHKTLQGYIRVVPSGTKIPIIMDTAVDSDTSQEGDEFSARTGEDLNIDGSTIVPAGSIIKGRIAQLNSPKNLGRSGSVALKFDTVTTPDNRQIPLVANLVARGGVVHARRGMKDIALDSTTVAVPLLLGAAIGLLAGSSKSSTTTTTTGTTSSSSKINKGEAAMIGAGVGLAVGVAILCIKKGKKVDVRPGDELKIELAEDLRMPM